MEIALFGPQCLVTFEGHLVLYRFAHNYWNPIIIGEVIGHQKFKTDFF